MNITKCPVCAGEREECFRAKLLHKHDVRYFYCTTCGLLQTEAPYWLEEAYSSAIADADTGLLARNYSVARTLSVLLYFVFGPGGKYLDVAGGYGALTRIMRDHGYDYYWKDKYCQNIFARGFEGKDAYLPYRAITAFEVLEHVNDPVDFVRKSLEENCTTTMVFSTELFEGDPPAPDWWYYAFATGQHVSFYQRRTLERISKEAGLRLYSHGNWHMLTDRRISAITFGMLTSRLTQLLAWYTRKRLGTKTMADHQRLLSGCGT